MEYEKQVAVWKQAAYELGVEHAKNTASWVTNGNETDESRRRKLELIEAGDPVMDVYLPERPNLSGEWADSPTYSSLFEDITGLDAHAEATWNIDAYSAVADALAEEYERGVEDTFAPACEVELRRWIGEIHR